MFAGGSLFGPLGLMIRGKLAAPFVRQRVLLFNGAASKANLVALRELAEAGKLTPAIDRTYPLAAAADAIGYVETGHARGKVVITV